MRRAFSSGLLLCAAALAQRPEFVRIPPGSLGGVRFEKPFFVGKTEVTVRQFAAFAAATGYRTTAEEAKHQRTWRNPGFKVEDRQPVVHVTSGDASAYCKWMGARLPTDAEWEYAARAGATTWHYWGDELDGRYLWYRANSQGRPQPVGKKLPNAWGLHDVEGNVWEWTIADPIDGQPAANRRGGSWVSCEWIDGGPSTKPPPDRKPTPLIGVAKYYKVPAKYSDIRYDDVGFRCACDDRPAPIPR